MSIVEFIEEKDVSTEKIESIFKRAFINAKCLSEAVWIDESTTFAVKIEIETKRKYIKFQSSVGIKEVAPISEKHAFANMLNGAVLVRFRIYDEIILIGDYYLPYDSGIPAFQIVNTYRIFSDVFTRILREVYEPGGLLDIS